MLTLFSYILYYSKSFFLTILNIKFLFAITKFYIYFGIFFKNLKIFNGSDFVMTAVFEVLYIVSIYF